MSATPSADIPQFEISSGLGPDDAYVVRVAGEVDMSHEAELRAELRAAVEADANGIVVDLTECEFIDSSAIRALLLSRDEMNSHHNGESLAVAASSGLDKVLPIEPTVKQAAAALAG